MNVFPIHAPALRERKRDIRVLALHFAQRYAVRLGKNIESIPEQAIDVLLAYDWPGNVRELENVIERAVILSSGPELELGEWLRGPGRHEPRILTLDEVQRKHILEVLELTGCRVRGPKGAAELLGMKPTTLEARMKRLGVCREDVDRSTMS